MSQTYLLVRLRPVDPYKPGRRTYTVMKRDGIPATLKFEEEKGWYKLPRSIGEVLRNEEDSRVPVFDVCTHEEAIKVEAAEEARRNAKAVKAKASRPNEMMVSAKSARDLSMDEPAPRVQPKPAPKAAPVEERLAPSEIDWSAVEEEAQHPAETISDERDEDDSEAVMETVDLSAPQPSTSEPEPAKKGRGRKSGK